MTLEEIVLGGGFLIYVGSVVALLIGLGMLIAQ